jgi:hypothetical protein
VRLRQLEGNQHDGNPVFVADLLIEPVVATQGFLDSKSHALRAKDRESQWRSIGPTKNHAPFSLKSLACIPD